MDPQLTFISREDIWRLHADMKTVQGIQVEHSERLARVERRQEDDARLRSVWGASSPFPGVLSGTPQQGPMRGQPEADADFSHFEDSHRHDLLGGLQLDHEEEPRRGASRANSVRFDETAIQGHWTQGSRLSGDFLPQRTGSGLGGHPMTERTLSHKSDGRQSSLGQSAHSAYSVHSGRTNSLGLDTNFLTTAAPTTPFENTASSPGLLILGTMPSIIRCWLDANFSHDSLLYADICSGSMWSLIDFALVDSLGLSDRITTGEDRIRRIKLPVFLPEAIIQQPSSRSSSPASQLPTLTINFIVVGQNTTAKDDSCQIYLGADVLMSHGADIMFSQNIMTIFGDDHSKLTIPLVRPEKQAAFRELWTYSARPGQAIFAGADADILPPFEIGGKGESAGAHQNAGGMGPPPDSSARMSTPASPVTRSMSPDYAVEIRHRNAPYLGRARGQSKLDLERDDSTARDYHAGSRPTSSRGRPFPGGQGEASEAEPGRKSSEDIDAERRESPSGIWGSWRRDQQSKPDTASSTTTTTSSSNAGFPRASRGRGMKVLRPAKSSVSSSRVQATSQPAGPSSSSDQAVSPLVPIKSNENEPLSAVTTELRRTASSGNPAAKAGAAASSKLQPLSTNKPRTTTNPVGGASAFAWLNGGGGAAGAKKEAAAKDSGTE